MEILEPPKPTSPVINASDMGPLYGDGIHDDTATINAAIAQANLTIASLVAIATGAVVYLPAGTYLVSSVLTPLAGATLEGPPGGLAVLKFNLPASVAANLITINTSGSSSIPNSGGGVKNIFFDDIMNNDSDEVTPIVANAAGVIEGCTFRNTAAGIVIADNGTPYSNPGIMAIRNNLFIGGALQVGTAFIELNQGYSYAYVENNTFSGVTNAGGSS